MVKTLIKEKENTDVVEICLEFLYRQVRDGEYTSFPKLPFVTCGICETLIYIMRIYTLEETKMEHVLIIIKYITGDIRQGTELLITAGLVEALVQIFNPTSSRYLNFTQQLVSDLVGRFCAYDESIIQQFYNLGIPEGSSFFEDVL